MKIRIKGNSLRYRLTRSDLATVTKEGYIEENTDFGQQTLIYALKVTETEELKAEFINSQLTLFISAAMVKEFADTDQVGFSHQSGPLHLLIEKDFTCLDNVEEDQSDNFPNPLAVNN
ncbi:hypothetical protein H7F33_04065 [Pedobacter sp. PAMC26386]|nr:hypothetical protein H7F33_04065 [Pedobacter sp. PAMC26386]